MGCRLIASEAISRAVFVTVDIISRYRVLSQLQRVGRFLILKAHWGLPRRLPHLLHTVTSPRTGSHKRIVRVTASLIPFHLQYITQCSVPSKDHSIGLTTALLDRSLGCSIFAVSLPTQLGVAKLIIHPHAHLRLRIYAY